jgi:hypothetical protein
MSGRAGILCVLAPFHCRLVFLARSRSGSLAQSGPGRLRELSGRSAEPIDWAGNITFAEIRRLALVLGQARQQLRDYRAQLLRAPADVVVTPTVQPPGSGTGPGYVAVPLK